MKKACVNARPNRNAIVPPFGTYPFPLENPMKMLLRLVFLCLGALCAAQAGATGNFAGPRCLVVGFSSARGQLTGAARIIAEKLPSFLNQPTIVENRGGAGGTLGALNAARATPDGNSTVLWYQRRDDHQPGDTQDGAARRARRSTTPIGEVGSVSFVLVVPASSPITSVQSLIARPRRNPIA